LADIPHAQVCSRREYFHGPSAFRHTASIQALRDVVELIDHRADVEEVAAATSLAAEQSMIDASQDAAVQHAFYLIAKIPRCAEHGFEAALSASE